MAIKFTQKVSITGPEKELPEMINTLKSTISFELTPFETAKFETGDTSNAKAQEYMGILARTNAVLDASKSAEAYCTKAIKKTQKHVNKALKKDPTDMFAIKTQEKIDGMKFESAKAMMGRKDILTFAELKHIGSTPENAISVIERLEQNGIGLKEIRTKIDANREILKTLEPYKNFEVPANILRSTKSSFVIYGTIENDQLEKFKSDFILDELIIHRFPVGNGTTIIAMIGHNSIRKLADIAFNYGFIQANFDFESSAPEQIRNLKEKNFQLKKDYLDAAYSCVLSRDEVKLLQNFHDYLANELDTENVVASALKITGKFVLNGWIPEGRFDEVNKIILAQCPDTKMEVHKITTLDKPPVIVRNNKLTAPYKDITNMYGAPGRSDIDPNPFVMFFYFIFFGMMVGDIGYGLVLVIGTLAFLYFKKPQGGTRNLLWILFAAGFSTILWGLFFGSFFGFDLSILGLPEGAFVVRPIEDAILLLAISMGLGMIHIATGLCLRLYNLATRGRVLDAILDAGTRVLFFIGAFMAIIGNAPGLATFVGADIDSTPVLDAFAAAGLWTILVSVGIILLTAGRKSLLDRNKGVIGKIVGWLIGGLSGLYGFVGYFSDILSYARLFGLALVGAVIAMVANDMGGLFVEASVWMIPVGVIVAVLFHAFNLALCLLSAYIHNSRLQFIEFFSKFYDGDGQPFSPLGGNLKYTYIKREVKETDDIAPVATSQE